MIEFAYVGETVKPSLVIINAHLVMVVNLEVNIRNTV